MKPAREETRGKKHGGEVGLGEEVLGCGRRRLEPRPPHEHHGLKALPVTPRSSRPRRQPLPPDGDGRCGWGDGEEGAKGGQSCRAPARRAMRCRVPRSWLQVASLWLRSWPQKRGFWGAPTAPSPWGWGGWRGLGVVAGCTHPKDLLGAGQVPCLGSGVAAGPQPPGPRGYFGMRRCWGRAASCTHPLPAGPGLVVAAALFLHPSLLL